MSVEFDALKASVEKLLHEHIEHSHQKILELENRINDGVAENKRLQDRLAALGTGENPDAEGMRELKAHVDNHANDVAAVSKPDPILNPTTQPKPATDPLGAPPPGSKADAFSAKPPKVDANDKDKSKSK